jgi:CBS domain-containing protein
MKIGELMTTGVRTCRANEPLSAAVQAMWDHDLGCLPVVDGDRKVIGMVTDRDAAMAVHFRGVPPWSIQVGDAMAKVVYSAAPGDGLDRAIELMASRQLRRLPVVDDAGRLAGMLSISDLARAGRKSVRPDEVARVVAAVTEPRPPTLTETIVVEVVREAPATAGTKARGAADVLRPAKRGARTSKPRKAPRSAAAAAPKGSSAGSSKASPGVSKGARAAR